MDMMEFNVKAMNVGRLKELIKDLPDGMQIRIAQGITGRQGQTVKMHSTTHVCTPENGILYGPDERRPAGIAVLALWT